MGDHHSKTLPSNHFFRNYYEETISQEYFTATKGFGYRKAPVAGNRLRKITELLPRPVAGEREEKGAKKKSFTPTSYPYSCIGALVAYFKESCSVATGCLIGPNLVITAASNVCRKEDEEQPHRICFILAAAGKDGDVYQVKLETRVPEKYLSESHGSHRYNYAVLEIEKRLEENQQKASELVNEKKDDFADSPGLVYGYLGINTRFSGLEPVYICGYSLEEENGETRLALRGERIDRLACKDGSMGYRMESISTECGSPILVRRQEHFHLVGMHICGKKELGTGLQLDEAVRAELNSWLSTTEGRLDLSAKGLEEKALAVLAGGDWRNLVVLNLDCNKLANGGLLALTRATWPVLRQLHACSNEIERLQFDPSAVKNLQVLYLTKNQIKDVQLMEELPILRVLQLSQNRVDNIDSLIRLKYLERLYLNANRLTKLPAEVERWTELKKLELSRNHIQHLPVELLRLRNLTLLALNGNKGGFQEQAVVRKLASNNVEVILR